MLDRNSPIPLHLQMETRIREKLNSGDWIPGQIIPSENELSASFGVSRMTLRNVITKLVHEGLLDRVPGKGTFVCQPKISASPLSYAGIREQLEQKGYAVTTRLLSLEKTEGSSSLCAHFHMEEGSSMYVLRRLRFIEGVPLSLHTSYIPVSFCPALDLEKLEEEQLCVILHESYGFVPAKTEETLESVAASPEEASLLSVRTGYPLLLLEDTTTDVSGKVYEFSKVVFRGDKIKIHLTY